MYSLLANMKYVLRKSYSYDKKIRLFLILHILCELILPLITLFTTSAIIYVLTSNIDVVPYLWIIGLIVLAGLLLLIQIINSWAFNLYNFRSTFARTSVFFVEISKEAITKDYEIIEPKSGQKRLSQGMMSIDSNWVGVEQMLKETPKIFVSVIGLIIYTVIVIIYIPWLLIVFVLMSAMNLFLSYRANKYMKKVYPESSKLNRESYYLRSELIDPKYGKDIRIYEMQPWFMKLYETITKKRVKLTAKIQKRYLLANISDSIFLFIRDGISYFILVLIVIDGKIDVATFSFLLGIVFGFSGWVNGSTSSFNGLRKANIDVNHYREFVEYENVFNHAEGLPISEVEKPIKITFKGVGFTYPETDKEVIKDFNFEINAGEKIALVGPNGSGKTTLVKLLTGLYRPTKGEILINDVDILKYNINDYMKLFSVVFQDSEPTAFTIYENVSAKPSEKTDKKRFFEVIEKAGLKEKIESLPNKENTYITQHFNEEGINLSGGETQKLMLARALYKNAPILVLDEPTSALDPLNEERMYQAYNSFTEGNTSLFISHRLSSTKFCDRIIYLENGCIKEVGAHQELMELNGQYRYVFDTQSQYYKEEGN
ncbi:MAG: ABC transporter ATP-binding protein [Acholeplasmatales bacterium]